LQIVGALRLAMRCWRVRFLEANGTGLVDAHPRPMQ
jgi:hypothetical protein